jgi:hypothetical protein
MAHRMQITLDDRQYERLREEADRTGASIAELVRRALDEKYRRELSLDEKLRLVDESAGALGEAWGRRKDAEADERRRRAAARLGER